jgi:hypothetical protein
MIMDMMHMGPTVYLIECRLPTFSFCLLPRDHKSQCNPSAVRSRIVT